MSTISSAFGSMGLRQPRVVTGMVLCLALVPAPLVVSAASNAEIRAKEAELARLKRELAEMQRVLKEFDTLSQRGQHHERNICGQYYRAAVNERTIIRQRQSIAGHDQKRAAAKKRYGEYRRQMIDCINKSVANDPYLRRQGVTGYQSLLSLYNRRQEEVKQVRPRYQAKQKQLKQLDQEIKTLKFGLPPIPEEDGTIVRTECPSNADPIWRGNKQSCKCHDPRAAYVGGGCIVPYSGPWPSGGPTTPPALLGQDPPPTR